MGPKEISESSAFSAGQDLWFVPDIAHSTWTKKIDWYLNFQMARANSHKMARLPDGLVEILNEEQLATPSTTDFSNAPLLISSRHRLPALQTIEVPYNGDIAVWISTVSKIWQELGRPSMRLFAPKDIDSQQLLGQWPKELHDIKIEYVYEAPQRN